jgi:hypothetical protein
MCRTLYLQNRKDLNRGLFCFNKQEFEIRFAKPIINDLPVGVYAQGCCQLTHN